MNDVNQNGPISPTLCCPDDKKSCFACCPPIRPAGYEHIQFQQMVRRILRENTDAFPQMMNSVHPITGYSCWGLGYLDNGYRRIGCLLHPTQNGGTDHRFRIEYGDKCHRETCLEAKEFRLLGRKGQAFWSHLTHSLDAFAYSSRMENPLFNLLGWGNKLLKTIATHEHFKPFTRESFFQTYRFFLTPLNPRGHTYLIHPVVQNAKTHLLKDGAFRNRFERFSNRITTHIRDHFTRSLEATYTHLLPFNGEFLNFLRMSAGLRRIAYKEALDLKGIVDQKRSDFYRQL